MSKIRKKKKKDRLNLLIKFKNFCASMDTINKEKMQPIEW